MAEGQVVRGAAILAGELVAQEQVEPGEGGMFRRLHILLQRDHRWDLHPKAGAVHLPLITGDDVHPIQKNRTEEHTSELQSLMRISYAVFCLKKKNTIHHT